MSDTARMQSRVREAAQRVLDEGGCRMVLGRSDRWNGRVLGDPMISEPFFHCEGAEAIEEDVMRKSFAAFRETYMAEMERLVEINSPVEAVA